MAEQCDAVRRRLDFTMGRRYRELGNTSQFTVNGREIVTRPHTCHIHSIEAAYEATSGATHQMTITRPDGTNVTITVCKEHGIWLNGRQVEEVREDVDPKRLEGVKPIIQNPNNRITGHKIPDPPDRGPGGGPGGRSMAPEPQRPPPPPQRTYPTYPSR